MKFFLINFAVSKNGIIKSTRESNYSENVKHESDTQDENEEVSHSSSNLLDMTNLVNISLTIC